MDRFVKGDIVVLEFPFSNMIDYKRRPSLILKIPKGDDFIVLQITGGSYEKDVEISISDLDFKKGSLKRESFVRIDKIATIKKTRIKYKIGSLKKEKFLEIVKKFMQYMGE